MSNLASYLKDLLRDLEKETDHHVSHYTRAFDKISCVVEDLSDGKIPLDNDIHYKLASIINAHISILRKLNIQRLQTVNQEYMPLSTNTVDIISNKTLQKNSTLETNEFSKPPAIYEHDENQNEVNSPFQTGKQNEISDNENNIKGGIDRSVIGMKASTRCLDATDFSKYCDEKFMGYLGLPPLTSPPAGSVVQIQVMHVSFMNMFYGAFYNNKPLGQFDDLEDLSNFLNKPDIKSTFKKITTMPVIGEFVLAPYSVDDCYYRAKIVELDETKSVDEASAKVFFIDYGNYDNVAVADLRKFIPECGNFAPQAIQCCILNIPIDPSEVFSSTTDGSREITNFLSTLLLGNVLTCKIVHYDGEIVKVLVDLKMLKKFLSEKTIELSK